MRAAALRSSSRAVAQPARHWLEVLTRWGFVANAVVYLILGSLMMRWAVGAGGRLTDAEGALRALQRQPLGNALLIALIPGFFSYALWRFLTAFYDGENDGSNASGLFCRGFGMLKGFLYAAMGVTAIRLAFGTDFFEGHATSGLLRGTSGVVILFIVGLGLFVFAASEAYRAYHARLSQGLRLHGVSVTAHRWIVGISRFGIGARAAVIGAFAILLVRAAAAGRVHTPRPQDLLNVFSRSNTIVYVLIGAGLVAYGIYLLVLAKYRRVNT